MPRAQVMRICVEFLPPAELSRREIVELLAGAGIAPMVAAPAVDRQAPHAGAQAEADAGGARALSRYRAAGLQPCIWPLLPDAAGYWPSAVTAAAFADRVGAFRAAAAAAGCPLQPGDVIAVDLEPPLRKSADQGGGHGSVDV